MKGLRFQATDSQVPELMSLAIQSIPPGHKILSLYWHVYTGERREG